MICHSKNYDIIAKLWQHSSTRFHAANAARQHPPAEYMYSYSSSHPILQFFTQKLAESRWIANNFAEELNVPPRPDAS